MVGLGVSSSSSSSPVVGFFVGGETGLRVRLGSRTGAGVGRAMGLRVSEVVGVAVGLPGAGEGKGVPSLASHRSGRGGTRFDCKKGTTSSVNVGGERKMMKV